MIKELMENVKWGELDYLLIDTPPGMICDFDLNPLTILGTSDEHISIAEYFHGKANVGAVLITTPQVLPLNSLYMA